MKKVNIVLIVLAILVLIYIYTKSGSVDSSGNMFKSNFGNVEPGPNDAVIVVASWCGHCKAGKPEFEKAVEDTKNQTNGKVVILDSDTAPGKKFMKANGVTGFPSIVHHGKIVSVSRTAEDIAKLTK
jgi:thiol-disulfide isomerase/thioredoxin